MNLFANVFSSDNLNGAQILGRVIRVDHVTKYKKKEEVDEETELKKREERGVCRAFQRGECTRGASCKFSHDEQVSKFSISSSFRSLTILQEFFKYRSNFSRFQRLTSACLFLS